MKSVMASVLAERKPHRAHIVVLAADGQSRRGHAEQNSAGDSRCDDVFHLSLSLPIAADLCLPLASVLHTADM